MMLLYTEGVVKVNDVTEIPLKMRDIFDDKVNHPTMGLIVYAHTNLGVGVFCFCFAGSPLSNLRSNEKNTFIYYSRTTRLIPGRKARHFQLSSR